MPPSSRSRRPARTTNAPTNTGATHTATGDLVQVTWVVGDRMYSREWAAGPESRDSVRAQRISLMGSGARNVSTSKIAAGASYTVHGER